VRVKFLFENHEIDLDRRELKRGGEQIAIEPQVFDLLVYLIENRDRVVTKDDLIDGVWGGRIVSESALTSRISAARKAIGDDGDAQRLIRTVPRKGIRFIGEVRGEVSPGAAAAIPPARSTTSSTLRQEIQFCVARDGARIAYASVGSGPPLLKTANWLSHLEYDWQSPIWTHLLQALAAKHRLIRYDARGNGLSDWEIDDISFDAFVQDLESVVAATGLERFSLLGISQGCAISIAYAVRHPERVARLVLYGGFARGKRRRGSAQDVEQADAILTLMRQGWGRENPAFRQIFTSLFLPGGTAEQMSWWNELQRKTASPENAIRIRRAIDDIDVSDLLPRVKVPTLVLHCRDDAVAPFEEGRRLAAGIPDARFVALEGRNHIILEDDPCWPRFLDEIGNFLQT
jgi:pimeloyl-ACP methyl ester carboxylesterase/DNA-binding winged helix-turn-helix (wHTH) protein